MKEQMETGENAFMRYNRVGNVFTQPLTQKNANNVLLHRTHHILFHIM